MCFPFCFFALVGVHALICINRERKVGSESGRPTARRLSKNLQFAGAFIWRPAPSPSLRASLSIHDLNVYLTFARLRAPLRQRHWLIQFDRVIGGNLIENTPKSFNSALVVCAARAAVVGVRAPHTYRVSVAARG